MIRATILAAIACGLLGLANPVVAANDEVCRAAAVAYLTSLDDQGRAQAQHPFDGNARTTWSYMPSIPGMVQRDEGLPLGELNAMQKIAAHRLIRCGLSSQGYQKAVSIMHLDDVLKGMAAGFPNAADTAPPIGSEYFWLAVFGVPATDDPWGWQLEGHHLTINFTVVDGAMSATPAFMGADPAEVQDGPYAGWRILGDEQDKGFALLMALDPGQRSRAILSDEQAARIFTGPGKGDALDLGEGLPAADMTPEQQELLMALIDEYVGNLKEPLSRAHMARIEEDGLDGLSFAWMGPTEPGQPVYYRVHGPSILIEFDHAGNSRSPAREPDPNHIHTIFRVPGSDFGEDLLRRHYETADHHNTDSD